MVVPLVISVPEHSYIPESEKEASLTIRPSGDSTYLEFSENKVEKFTARPFDICCKG